MRTACSFFKKIFSPRQRTQKDKFLQHILRTRAWIIHCALSFVKVALWVSGKSIWLSKSRSCFGAVAESSSTFTLDKEEDCVAVEFDQELVDNIRPAIRYISMTLIICAVLLDLVTYKWRMCADWALLFELVWFMTSSTMPSSENTYTGMYMA